MIKEDCHEVPPPAIVEATGNLRFRKASTPEEMSSGKVVQLSSGLRYVLEQEYLVVSGGSTTYEWRPIEVCDD